MANVLIKYVVDDKQLRDVSKRLAALEKQNGLVTGKVAQLNSQFKSLNTTTANTNKRLAGISTTLKNVGAAFGVSSAVLLFANAVRSATKTVVDFQKQNAVLAGILGKSRQEISALTRSAKEYGATTARTASEVTQLQIALARLGFQQQEIIDLTGGIIKGSIALNASLDETAELVGAIVRTFEDFGTTDADEIIDQLTLATQRSALNFGRLQTSLPIVSGAAEAAGIPFTRLLALLGKLADAGIDTSTSATALRNIFIESASQGRNYQEILEEVVNSSDRLTASTDEFGKRAAVSASILSRQISQIEELDFQLQNAGGTADKVAKEQLATLEGSITLLSSAWEGLILSIEDGDGALGQSAKDLIDITKSFINLVTFINENFGETISLLNDFTGIILNPAWRLYSVALSEINDSIEETKEEVSEATKEFFEFENELARLGKTTQQTTEETEEQTEALKAQQPILASLKEELKRLTEERDQAFSADQVTNLSGRIDKIKSKIDLLTKGWDAFTISVTNSAMALNDVSEEIANSEILKLAQEGLDSTGDDIGSVVERLILGDEPQEIVDEFEAVNEEVDAVAESFFQKQEDRERRQAELKKQLASDAFNVISSINNRQADNKIRNLERELDAGLITEEKFNKEVAKIRRKEARGDRDEATFKVVLETAKNVAAAFPNPFLIAAAKALGIAQIALINSEPLPRFEKGGKIGGKRHSQGGTIIEAEQGEYVLNRDAVNHYGLSFIDAINDMSLNPQVAVSNDLSMLADAIKGQPHTKLVWDESGFTAYQRKGNSLMTFKSNRYATA